MQTIEITISPDGELKLGAAGIKGASCKQKTQPMEQALGMDPNTSRKTAEYYQAEMERERNG